MMTIKLHPFQKLLKFMSPEILIPSRMAVQTGNAGTEPLFTIDTSRKNVISHKL